MIPDKIESSSTVKIFKSKIESGGLQTVISTFVVNVEN